VLVAPPATPKTGTTDATLAIVEAFCNPEAFFHAVCKSIPVIPFLSSEVEPVSELEDLACFLLASTAAFKEEPSCAFKIPPCSNVNSLFPLISSLAKMSLSLLKLAMAQSRSSFVP
jgi:hypothetical protein